MNMPRHPSPGTPRAEWAQRPERSNRVMLRMMAWLTLKLGRAPTRPILGGAIFYYLIFSPVARAASRAYLRRALGREPRLADLFRHFHSFASTIHDRFFLINARFDLFQVEVHGEAVIREVLAAGRGAFLMGAHLGSFEVMRALGRRQPGLKVGMVMYEENARKLNAALAAMNPAAEQDIIPLGQLDSMLRVRSCLDAGMVLGMLGDRTLGDGPTVSIPFLGENAEFPVGPMRLAAMLGRPVLFMSGLYLGGNRYAIHFERLADFGGIGRQERDAAIQMAIAAYVASLERHSRSSPYNWFNFFDFWRRKGACQ
ncbi:MAG: acyl-CoA synthetase [Thiobacillus sp. 63-78]|uniref:LpxL/LpxP family acyltransferase n=1 Tax=Thiobacillus sp. 63-78 TaxID=1895859 RepID=UPI000967F323|nr:acyl-CoA synthetase [Thiobacillus sp. 63-78]OJZ15807.1 MAG: acyl-CoA synthetase [Thiobacillus sp. 63-78]